MEANGASTETKNLTREEQHDLIDLLLNKNFQSEGTESEGRIERWAGVGTQR